MAQLSIEGFCSGYGKSAGLKVLPGSLKKRRKTGCFSRAAMDGEKRFFQATWQPLHALPDPASGTRFDYFVSCFSKCVEAPQALRAPHH